MDVIIDVKDSLIDTVKRQLETLGITSYSDRDIAETLAWLSQKHLNFIDSRTILEQFPEVREKDRERDAHMAYGGTWIEEECDKPIYFSFEVIFMKSIHAV